MTQLVTILILCLIIISCSSQNDNRTEAVLPMTASTIEPQKTVSTTLDCQNVKDVIGFADISFDATTNIYFYEQPNVSEQPAQTLRFYEDKTINSFSFRAEGEKTYSLLNPKRHKLDYSIFDLAVKSKRDGWLEVLVDEQTNDTLWLQENKVVQFKDWQQVMKKAFAIGRLNTEMNPLRTKPDLTGKFIAFGGSDCLKFEQLKGDWIKVTQGNHCNTDLRSTPSGWIKWRDQNGCLLIDIFPFA